MFQVKSSNDYEKNAHTRALAIEIAKNFAQKNPGVEVFVLSRSIATKKLEKRCMYCYTPDGEDISKKRC